MKHSKIKALRKFVGGGVLQERRASVRYSLFSDDFRERRSEVR